MSAALRPSWACRSVSLMMIGIPLASTRAWILVDRPPRERPMHSARAWSRASAGVACGPLFDVAAMLMDPDRGGVDHLQVAVIGLRSASKIRSQTPIFAQRRNRLAQV